MEVSKREQWYYIFQALVVVIICSFIAYQLGVEDGRVGEYCRDECLTMVSDNQTISEFASDIMMCQKECDDVYKPGHEKEIMEWHDKWLR